MAGNIGIIGRARVGKDTAGKWLVDRRGYERVGFADALKDAALKLDPWITYAHDDGDWLNGIGAMRMSEVVRRQGWERAKDNFPEVRRILQELGASVRAIDPEVWLRTALKKVTAANEAGSPAVVTDVRYPNEAESLKRAGFHLIQITRPGIAHLDHESEGALGPEDADYQLVNCGSISGLHVELDAIMTDVYAIESRRQYGRSF